jgi:MFS family permease
LHASQETSDTFSANIVSLLQAGCFFGSLAVAPIGDRYGRRIALIIAGVLFCIGSLMQTVSFGSVAAMFVGRAVGGLVSGILNLHRLDPVNDLIGSRVGKWSCAVVRSRTLASSHSRQDGRNLRD